MMMQTDLKFCKDLSIYLGHTCNFDCQYCDRGYIRNTIGGQGMSRTDLDNAVLLIDGLIHNDALPPMISFHGGEPFSYVKGMTSVLDSIKHDLVRRRTIVFIQSNGSQILDNEAFFQQFHGLDIIVSISYDFAFQSVNRTVFDLRATLEMLKRYDVRVQLQYVMPLTNPACFSFDVIREIMSYTGNKLVRRINLIPLRHIRGKDKFKLVLEDLDLNAVFLSMLKFVEILYVLGIKVSIDGHGHGIQKDYFHGHKQVILSPDGLVYPEYDFLEYKMDHASIGDWSAHGIHVYEVDETPLVHDECLSCTQAKVCGLKYLFKAFDRKPEVNRCVHFYKLLTMLTHHVQKLNTKSSLTHWMASV